MADASFRARIHIGINYKDTIRNLQAVGLGIRSPQIRGAVAEALLKWIEKNFKTEGKLNYPSTGWEPLSEGYSKEKGGRKSGTRIKRKKIIEMPSRKGPSFVSIDPRTGTRRTIYYKDVYETRGGKEYRKRVPLGPTVRYEKSRVLKRILVLTGKMEGSFSEKSTAMGRPPKGDMRVIIGSDVDYARYHEFGTRSMPQRKILPWPSIAREVSDRAVEKFIQAIVDKNQKI